MRRSDYLGRIGPFDEQIPGAYGEDYEWLLRAAKSAPVAVVPKPLARIYWHDSSFFDGRWKTMIAGLRYVLDKHPDFERKPKGLARVHGQLALAYAAAGEHRESRRFIRATLRGDWRQPRAWLALLATSRMLRPERLLRLLHRFGRGILGMIPPAAASATGARACSRAAWPLYALFVALPLWWALGGAYFIWPLVTFPLLFAFLLRGDLRVPPRFGIWLLFLGWSLTASLVAETDASIAVLLYRISLYVSATLLFLWVFNSPRDALPDARIVKVMATFWAAVIVGGFVGVLMPNFSFSTPVQAVLPGMLLKDPTVYNFVHPGLADVMHFLGYPVGRPKTLFAFTNQWGACAAVLTPFALAALSQLRRGAARRLLGVLLLLSIVPIVVSLNRGLWLALGLGLVYAGVRLAGRGDVRALAAIAVALAATALVVALTPLSALVEDRVTGDQTTTNTRHTIYDATIDKLHESPIFGFGSPSLEGADPDLPALGSHGRSSRSPTRTAFPRCLRSWRGSSTGFCARFGGLARAPWCNAAILVLLVELPYYNFMPATLHVAMVAAALLWRDVCPPTQRVVRPRVITREPVAASL